QSATKIVLDQHLVHAAREPAVVDHRDQPIDVTDAARCLCRAVRHDLPADGGEAAALAAGTHSADLCLAGRRSSSAIADRSVAKWLGSLMLSDNLATRAASRNNAGRSPGVCPAGGGVAALLPERQARIISATSRRLRLMRRLAPLHRPM